LHPLSQFLDPAVAFDFFLVIEPQRGKLHGVSASLARLALQARPTIPKALPADVNVACVDRRDLPTTALISSRCRREAEMISGRHLLAGACRPS
jgi:hypothetical protein